jgi:hypothetical protein
MASRGRADERSVLSTKAGASCQTLFGLYEAIEAVNTTAPLMLSLMNARAATLAQ